MGIEHSPEVYEVESTESIPSLVSPRDESDRHGLDR
jgi:hypothetical protein